MPNSLNDPQEWASASTGAGPTVPRGCSIPGAHVIAELRRHVTNKTDEALNERFGISYNTWKKLIAGNAVGTSLLIRLERRLGLEAIND